MTEVVDIGEFSCGDGAALVAFLYDECSEAERAQISAHVARCAGCAEEIAAMGGTREQLAAWTPPDHALGFQLTPTAAAPPPAPATVLSFDAAQTRRARWWNQPLPAWAQAAAAVAIFASGLAIGAARNASVPVPVQQAAVQPSAAQVTPAATPTNAAAVSRADLAQLEARLTGQIAQSHPTAAPASTERAGDDRAVLARVQQLIAESEQRQQRELALRVSDIVRDEATTRQIDKVNFERRLADIADGTTRRVNTNQQQINSIIQRGLAQSTGYTPNSPYVP